MYSLSGAGVASLLTLAPLAAEGGASSDLSVDRIEAEEIALAKPKLDGELSLERALHRRRSRRKFTGQPITLVQLSQLLWAGQGITGELQGTMLRAAPSAGALYPMDLYVVLPKGVYRYNPPGHILLRTMEGDKRMELAWAALDQEFIAEGSVDLVITAEYERSMVKYDQRGIRYSVMEAGNISENIYLQAESLGLATVAVGAFYDDQVSEVLRLPKAHRPLLIMPVGYPRY